MYFTILAVLHSTHLSLLIHCIMYSLTYCFLGTRMARLCGAFPIQIRHPSTVLECSPNISLYTLRMRHVSWELTFVWPHPTLTTPPAARSENGRNYSFFSPAAWETSELDPGKAHWPSRLMSMRSFSLAVVLLRLTQTTVRTQFWYAIFNVC